MRNIFFVLVILFYSTACSLQGNQPIGLMGAMEEEIDLVKASISNLKEINIEHNVFYTGTINDKEVVLSLSGIGTVNAAITTTLLANHFQVKAIIFTGVGGAITNNLDVGDIVIGTNFIHYDVDLTAFGLELGHLSRETVWKYPSDPKLIDLALTVAQNTLLSQKVVKGRIISGDHFMKDKALRFEVAQQFKADAIDMESSSVAHIAYKFGIPVVIIRAMSNSTEGDDKEQYLKFFENAVKNSANILLKINK